MGLLDIFNKKQPVEDQASNRKSKDIDDRSIRVQLFRFMNSIELYKVAITNFENTVFPTNEELIRVYNDVVLDSHVFALMEARKQKVLSKDFKIVDEDGEEITEETELLNSTWFMDSLNLALDSIFYGFSLIQLGDREGLSFKGVKIVPREYVYPQEQLVRETPTSNRGTSYVKGVYAPWLVPAGRPEDLGVLSKVAPMQIYKKAALGSWAMFTAIFGNPLRIGRTNVRDEKLRDNMAAMLEQMDVATYGVFDHEDTVEFVQAAKTDAYNVFDKAIERCNSEISKAIIGSTMVTDEGSSRSQSEVHERTAAAFVKKDAMYLQYWVNKVFIPHLNQYHGFNITGRWVFDETEVISLAEQFERDVKLAELYDLPAEYIREQYGVPVQDRNEDSLAPGDIENALSLGKYTPLEGAIKDFYRICCNQDALLPADGDDFRVITKQQEEELYKGIYSGEYSPASLPVELYVGTGEALSDGIEEGLNEYNKLGLGYVPDQGFFDTLRDNAYKFSAAKTYQQVLDMSSYLIDPETGEQVSFAKFKKQAAETFGTYNKNYLRAEYNNAFNGSQMASKWQDAVESAEDFPYLKYWTANDLRVRADHKQLDDIIQPIGSDFWAKYYPPNGWNCRCTVVKVTDLDEPTKLGRKKLPELPTEFEHNIGQTRQIYSPEHPYFVVAPQYTPALQALPQPAPRELKLDTKLTPNKVAEDLKKNNIVYGDVNLKGMNSEQLKPLSDSLRYNAEKSFLSLGQLDIDKKVSAGGSFLNNSITIHEQYFWKSERFKKLLFNQRKRQLISGESSYYTATTSLIVDKKIYDDEEKIAYLYRRGIVDHEVNHALQSYIEAGALGGYGDELKKKSKKWYNAWKREIKKKREQGGWYPSEYPKIYVEDDTQQKEYFAEAKLLYDYKPELVEDKKVRELLKEADEINKEIDTYMQKYLNND